MLYHTMQCHVTLCLVIAYIWRHVIPYHILRWHGICHDTITDVPYTRFLPLIICCRWKARKHNLTINGENMEHLCNGEGTVVLKYSSRCGTYVRTAFKHELVMCQIERVSFPISSNEYINIAQSSSHALICLFCTCWDFLIRWKRSKKTFRVRD